MSLGTYTIANGRVYDLVELVKAEGERRFDSYLVRSREEPHYEGWIAKWEDSWVWVTCPGSDYFVIAGDNFRTGLDKRLAESDEAVTPDALVPSEGIVAAHWEPNFRTSVGSASAYRASLHR